jgi:hypothetical protein
MSLKKSTSFSNKHRSISSGKCLVSELASELLSHQGPLSEVCVVLPTQRLSRYLVRELVVRQGGACLLPRIDTWETFVESILAPFKPTELVMVSAQAELVMETVITQAAESPGRERLFNVNKSHAHELLHFYSELCRAGQGVDSKDLIKDRLDSQWHHSEATTTVLGHRIDDVFEVLAQFESRLLNYGWITRAAMRSQAIIEYLREIKDSGGDPLRRLIGDKRLLICGLTSLPKIETDLLTALARSDQCSVWLDAPPPYLKKAPLLRLRSAVGLTDEETPEAALGKNIRTIHSATDVTHEATRSLNLALDLIQSGVAPHDIAIIVTDETAYGPVYSSVKEHFETHSSKMLGYQLSVNLPLANSWSCSSVATWLGLCKNLARQFNLGDFGQYVLSPITQRLFNGGSLDFIEFQQQLKNVPEYLDLTGERLVAYLSKQFGPDICAYATSSLTWCMNQQPMAAKSVDQMADKLLHMMTSQLVDDFKKTPRQKEAWRIVTEAVSQVRSVAGTLEYADGEWARFLADVYRCCESEVLRDTGEPLSGLQIIGLTEARYIPFSYVIIVGCVEGSFPQALPVDSLVDNALRESVGIPGWSDLEALEDTTFHLLTSRVPNVDLSYPRSDNEAPQVRSRWIEMLRSQIPIHEAGPNDGEIWLGCSKDPPESYAKPDSAHEGISDNPEELLKHTSASRLKSLLWCPYRYLLEMRRIETVELPEDRKPLFVGQILHKVLETFFRDEELPGISPALELRHCPSSGPDFVDWAVMRLEAITTALIPSELRRSEDFQQMLGKGWLDVARFWGQLLESGFSINSVETELSIGKVKPADVSISGLDVKLRGSIDAVHRSGDFAVLVDYKTSSVPNKRLISIGLEPQLPLYAEALSQSKVDRDAVLATDQKNMAAIYFNLRDGKPTVAAVGEAVKPLLQSSGIIGRNARADDLEEAVRAVRNQWSSRLDSIRASQRFEADPSDCDYCPFDGICRKDDPRYKDAIAAQVKAGKL